MDLSVAHDNAAAIRLYEKLGFRRVPVLAIKRKNAINEPLFTPPPETVDDLNPYARIIADEALRRGIWVEVLDAETGEMRLTPRRSQRDHPRIAVGVHLRGRDVPLRRQKIDPAACLGCRHHRPACPAGDLRRRRLRVLDRGGGSRRQTHSGRAGQRHHRRRYRRERTRRTRRRCWHGRASNTPRC